MDTLEPVDFVNFSAVGNFGSFMMHNVAVWEESFLIGFYGLVLVGSTGLSI